MRAIALIGTAAITVGFSLPLCAEPAVDWSKIGAALGKPGTEMPGDVYRVGLPRTDLHVTVDGIVLKPALALGGWLAFKAMGSEAMVMGDLVLTEGEVNAVMTRIEESGIEITALHNHLLRATPNTMYMHILGHGDPSKLAAMLHHALDASSTPLQAASAAAQPQTIGLDTAAIDRTLGFKGKVVGGVYQMAVPRGDKISDSGMPVPGRDGLSQRDQLPALEGRKGRHCRRSRALGARSQSGVAGSARKRDRSDGGAQPHAGRPAARLLHAFLGSR
jgi:hypothetical protein